MKQVNIHEAKTHLSQLIADVEGGEEVVIARAGKPVARLSQMKSKGVGDPRWPNRRPGRMKGKMWAADDWDSPETNAEIAAMFYASENDRELFGDAYVDDPAPGLPRAGLVDPGRPAAKAKRS